MLPSPMTGFLGLENEKHGYLGTMTEAALSTTRFGLPVEPHMLVPILQT